MVRSCWILIIFLLPTLAYSQARRALGLIDKMKYDQAEELLYKSISKDSLNAGENYVLSILYFTDDFPNYNLDSAHYYALNALEDYEVSDEKTVEKLRKDEIVKNDLIRQKDLIEAIAFSMIKKENTESGYISYLEKYSSSLKYDSAILLRNQVAFENVEMNNTWQDYKEFMEKYPESAQFEQANARYEQLIYDDKTSDHKLSSYEKFLMEFPDTPYRTEIEQVIFNITTSTHIPEDYSNFISRFPDNENSKIAAARIYHILKGTKKLADYYAQVSQYHRRDSIETLEKLASTILIPVKENSSFKFIDQDGNTLINQSFDNIPESYRCGNITSDLLVVGENGKSKIINRSGYEIYKDENITRVEHLDKGIILFEKNGKKGLIYITGQLILAADYDDIRVLQGQYIAYLENDLWGITSINGIPIFSPQFTEVGDLQGFIQLYNQENKFTLVDPEALKPMLDGGSVDLNFHLDDIELIDSSRFLIYSDEKQGIVNLALDPLIPEREQELIPVENGLFIESSDGTQFITDDFELNPAVFWEDYDFNELWILLKGPNGWMILSASKNKIVDEYIDSVKLLNRSTVLSFKNGVRRLHFESGEYIALNRKSRFEVISSPPVENTATTFYTLIRENDSKWLLDGKGDTLLVDYFSEVRAFGSEYIVVSGRNGTGLFSSTGNLLLKPTYDGIANYNNGSLTILKDGKLGYYRYADSTFIPPQYVKSIQPYGDTLFIANNGDGYGIINRSLQEVTDFIFDDIAYFSDSVSWVKKDDNWNLLNLKNNVTYIDEVISFSPIHEEDNEFSYYLTPAGKGVLQNKTGTIIKATFNDILNIGSRTQPVFMAEKYIEEADFYVIVYYDSNGKTLYRQAYPSEEYEDLICEN